MQCPRDQTPLRQVKRRETTLDLCNTCHGKWLDEGELEQLVLRATEVQTSTAALTQSRQAIERDAFFHDLGRDAEIRCPRCGVTLKKVSFVSGGSEVTADRCPQCHGYWFDLGEHGALFVLLERHLPIRPALALGALLVAVAAAFLLLR